MFEKLSTPIKVIAVILAVLGISVIWSVDLGPSTGSQATNDCTSQSQLVEYPGEDSQTALALLERDNEVTKQSYDFGDLVTSINGKSPENGQFILFCVDGQPSSVGASDYTTNSSELISWHLAPIR